MNHKRPKQNHKDNVKHISHVFAFIVLIKSCCKQLLAAEHLEEYFPTVAWIMDECEPTIYAMADRMTKVRAFANLDAANTIVERFRKQRGKHNSVQEHGDIWLVTTMAMLMDDITVALRDPKKKEIIEPLAEAVFKLQTEVEGKNPNFVDTYDDANNFIKQLVEVM